MDVDGINQQIANCRDSVQYTPPGSLKESLLKIEIEVLKYLINGKEQDYNRMYEFLHTSCRFYIVRVNPNTLGEFIREALHRYCLKEEPKTEIIAPTQDADLDELTYALRECKYTYLSTHLPKFIDELRMRRGAMKVQSL